MLLNQTKARNRNLTQMNRIQQILIHPSPTHIHTQAHAHGQTQPTSTDLVLIGQSIVGYLLRQVAVHEGAKGKAVVPAAAEVGDVYSLKKNAHTHTLFTTTSEPSNIDIYFSGEDFKKDKR